MNLIRWTGKQEDNDLAFMGSPFGHFRTELDRLFDRFFDMPSGLARQGFSSLAGWAPSTDVSESDKAVTVRAEVPGVDPKDIEVTLSDDVLTISGEKKERIETKEEGSRRSERRFGAFRRTLPLPSSVDADSVSAKYENGVLVIELSKREGAAPKRIPVRD
jgi:HSP20 family protein